MFWSTFSAGLDESIQEYNYKKQIKHSALISPTQAELILSYPNPEGTRAGDPSPFLSHAVALGSFHKPCPATVSPQHGYYITSLGIMFSHITELNTETDSAIPSPRLVWHIVQCFYCVGSTHRAGPDTAAAARMVWQPRRVNVVSKNIVLWRKTSSMATEWTVLFFRLNVLAISNEFCGKL